MTRFELVNRASKQPLLTVDKFVESFEAALVSSGLKGSQHVNVLDYLPMSGDSHYLEVVAELFRVDMEHSWSQGAKKRLADYRSILPAVFQHQEVLEQVAFEEYRLRAQAGEQVSAEQYQSEYGIPIDHWTRCVAPPKNGNQDSSRSSIPELWQEALELADDVHAFPAEGESFSGFTLDKEIGRGAFSRVFLARQGELAQRDVVLKIASGNSLEPQHLARLQHTNIVPIYSVHRQEKLTAVCMPYFGLRTLADLLNAVRKEPETIGSKQNLISTFLNQRDPTEIMPTSSTKEDVGAQDKSPSTVLSALTKSNYVDAVIWIIKFVTEGITHAHERGIVHRDLKPANVLLTNEGLPMVLDFNLSEKVVVNGRTSLLVGGTLPYMSPEHLAAVSSGASVGYQADLFSLGVILFELLTGKRPFPDRSGAFEDVVQEMIADRQTAILSVRDSNPSVPPSIEAVVCRCLAPNLKDRYQTAAHLAEDLDKHMHSEPLLYAPDRSLTERTQKWLKRHPRVSSAGGVAVVASFFLALMLGFWLLRGHRLARLEAAGVLENFRVQQPELQLVLGLPATDPQILQEGLATSLASLAPYALLESDDWRSRTEYHSLTAADQSDLDHRLAEVLFLMARANHRLIATAGNTDEGNHLAKESLKLNQLAIDCFDEATCPLALLSQHVMLLEGLGKMQEANRLQNTIAELPASKHVIDKFSVAYELLAARKYAEAEPVLMELRNRYPAKPLPWVLLGDAQVALHQLSESEGSFTTAIALNPNLFQAYYHRGRCRMDLKQYHEARKDFDRVIALRPQLACGYLNRALTHRSLRNYQEAIADLTKALELGATQTRIYFLRSNLRKSAGDLAGAAEDKQLGLELTPTDEVSWVSRGAALLQTDPEAALLDFQQALQLNPASTTALHNCVHVLADRLDQPQQALEAISQLLLLNEKDTDALAGRAVLYARQGNHQAALADIQRLLRLSREPKALFQAACALSLSSEAETSDLEKALTLISQAVQVEPRWFVRAHTDPDLKALRKSEAFQAFAANYRTINRMKIDLDKKSKSK